MGDSKLPNTTKARIPRRISDLVFQDLISISVSTATFFSVSARVFDNIKVSHPGD